MIDILIAVGIFLGVSVVCDVLLILADKYFAIKEDATVVAIRDCLPGANCGACGYSGCDGYAKALAEGKTVETNLCVPGGDGTACGIASILGLEAKDVVERVAYVSCNGTCDAAKQKYEYSGYNSCRIQNLFYSGEKLCPYACLGCGDCAAACPYGAISIEGGVAKVESTKCIGCGLCERQCPVNAILKTNYTAPGHKLPSRVIDTDKCVKCGLCMASCKFKAIEKK